jgi:YfiH family protein
MMRKLIQGRLSVFKFESFREYKSLAHFITTREGWASGENPRFTGDDKSVFEEFRKELAVSCEVGVGQLFFPRQTHSDHVAIITDESTAIIPDTDALITNVSGKFLCVQSADCVPVLLYDPKKNVIAAVHAGWRGTVSKIITKTVQRMTEAFGCQPSDLVAGIGPSIHIHAYEVGPEVIEAVLTSFKNPTALLKPSLKPGKAYFDLWLANQIILSESGIKNENIEVLGLCTFGHPELFYSARRDGSETGRIASGICLM